MAKPSVAPRPAPRRACTQCGIKRTEDQYTGPRGRTCAKCLKANRRAQARAQHVKQYGITIEEYAELAKDGCQACGGQRPYNLQIDHDHDIAAEYGMRASIRGALCKRCNKLLRDAHDSPELLDNLKNYLNRPPAKGVLFP